MKDLFRHLDRDHNGMIDFKEFIELVQVHDIDPDYNPFFEGRRRQLKRLKDIYTAPWPYQKETAIAEAYASKVRAEAAELERMNDQKKRDTVTQAGPPGAALHCLKSFALRVD